MNNILKIIQGWVKLKGGTDNALIGNIGDALKVTSSIAGKSGHPFYFDVACGNYNSYIGITKYGRIPDVNSNTTQDVTNFGNITWLTTASLLNIVSTSANDTLLSSTGAQKLEVSGLDSNYNIQTETVNLNGTTSVQTLNTFLTAPRVLCLSSNDIVKNQGDITITANTGGSVQAKVLAGKGSAESCFWQVPQGYTCYILNSRASIFSSSGAGNKQGFIEFFMQSPGYTWTQASSTGADSGGGEALYMPDMPLCVPEKTRCKLTATSYQNNTSFTGMFQFVLVPNA